MFLENKKVYFVGIGGIGMSGLAKILLGFCNTVGGSDPGSSYITDELKDLGADIIHEHSENNIIGYDIVVFSSAIKNNNPEYIKATKLGLPIMKRADLLAELMRAKTSIAVAGSHGKTTSSSILATILDGCKLDPSYIIGGIVNNFKSHAHFGEGEFLVAEADESDGSFHILKPKYTIITNIDKDHLDFFKTFENVKQAFSKYIEMIPNDGMAILNIDDVAVAELFSKTNAKCSTIGLSKRADYFASDVSYEKGSIKFSITHERETYSDFEIYGFGEHNLLNTLGAIAIAHKLGQNFKTIKESLLNFKGAKRRLDKLSETNKTIIYDDYAHHTTEVYKTLKALKESFSDLKVECIFQPHRYSRMKDSWNDIRSSFEFADKVYVLDIFAAGEEEIEGVTPHSIINEIGSKAVYIKREDIPSIIRDTLDSRVIACLGAGTISKWIREDVSKTC